MSDDKHKNNDNPDKVRLKKEINIFSGIAIIVSVVVGSGIFVSPVGVLKYTKSVGLSFVMWTVTGLFSLIGSLVYAELGVTIQKSGGEYVYILETFGGVAAFITLWITFMVIGAGSTAASSIIFAEYALKMIYPNCTAPAPTIFIVAILGIGNYNSFIDSFERSDATPGALALAFYQGFWAFGGWNYLNFVIGEVKNPARNVPIVLVSSISLVTTIYLLTNVAYLAVLSPYELLALSEESVAVAAVFASRCMGFFTFIMPLFVSISVMGTMNGEIIAMSRLAFTASEEGHLPAILSMVNINTITPIPAIILLITITLLYIGYRDLFYLIGLSGFAFSVMSELSVLSLLYLRRYRPGLNKSGFKLPIIFPIIYLIVNGFIGVMTVYQEPTESLISIGLMALAIPIYVVGSLWKKSDRLQSTMLKLTLALQRTLAVVPQESEDGDPIKDKKECKNDGKDRVDTALE